MKDETKLWLEQAKEDYEDALYNFAGHRYGITTWLCQQVVEKMLKAAMVEIAGKRPPKTHDLVRLSEECGLKIPKKWENDFEELTKYYFKVRYPDMNKKFFSTNKITVWAVNLIKEVYPWLVKKLSQ